MASRTRRGGSGPWKRREGADLDIRSLEEAVLGPVSARLDGFEVQRSVNPGKRYRCPYCEGFIEPGAAHTVGFPAGRPEVRRHYHTACWTRHANSTRGGRRSPA